MDPRIMSANSFADLARFATGTRALDTPLADAVRAAPFTADVREALLRAANREAMSVGAFFSRKDLHRALSSLTRYATLVHGFRTWLQGAADDDLTDHVADARDFGTLADVIEHHPIARTNPADLAGTLPLHRDLRLLFLRVANTCDGDLFNFLSLADGLPWRGQKGYVLQAFKDWLTEELDAAPSNVAALERPVAPSPRAILDKLALPGLEDCPLNLLNAFAGYTTIGDAIDEGHPRVGALLSAFAERVEQLRRKPPPPPALVSHAEPALARFHAAALAERDRLLPTWPRGLVSGRMQYKLSGARLELQVSTEGASPVQLALDDLPHWHERPAVSCACKGPSCLHRVIVLDHLCANLEEDRELAETLVTGLRPPWERVLDSIASATAPKANDFVLSVRASAGYIDFALHAVGKRGASKRGKTTRPAAAIHKLSGLDRQLAERFAVAETDSRLGPLYGDAVLALAGHPRVHWLDEAEPLPVERVEACVRVEESARGFTLRFFAGGTEFTEKSSFVCSTGYVVVVRAADRILLVHFTETFRRLFASTLQLGAELPREAAPKLAHLLPTLEAAATVELPDDLRGEERPPASRPLVRVLPQGDGLALAVRVEPLERGPVFVPAQGVAVSAAFDGRKRAFTRRDFERELAEANAVAGSLGLDPAAAPEPYTWPLDRSPRHVETLRRLSALDVPVEWQAPRVKFTAEAKLDRLRLTVTKQRDWFGLEGELTVDDRRVALAALLEAARERRRFVKLGEDDYAQLSEQLVDQLSPLAHLAPEGKPPAVGLGAMPLLDALAPKLEALDAAKEWRALMDKLATARTTAFPLPKGLEASLRDYQREGFEWLCRLAEWGTGACLADDMGLGKTLQALALLLHRAGEGPALVVAPSSVLHTWRAEAKKFAPSLALRLFHEGDRELGALGPKDVLVVSWTLFAREAERFAAVKFATAVLDEAHAIKNAGTQRAKAAHRLQAGFVVALSGTPVENHVGELWSLLRAVMPALLGPEDSFRARFGSGSREALKALAALVQPFILRRTKGAVAKELPARTDLDVLVPLTAEERALYDDVRLSAMAELGDVTGEGRRFEVLAALTRLRLTACHPRLVDKEWQGAASKLSRLLELVRDLGEAGHRVLVFSQFTQHLALVVDALRKDGVAFSYLDGQVPVAERQRRVEAFQRGEGGDVFLISLKAGGTGLTLTAADYVIHLDPWWNPAVEDQASDRAHRIGQSRPVTVYRLIAEGTIEQQILSLHAEKRELVDALLEGSDGAGKLSTLQLAELIRGGPSFLDSAQRL